MNYYSKYQANSIQTAGREDILLKLYEGAILRLKKAQQLREEGEHIQAREQRSQALAIITELDNTLDWENGDPELLENLDGLYFYMIQELNASAQQDDFSKLQPVIDILQSLYQGWEEAVQIFKKGEDSAEETSTAAHAQEQAPKKRILAQG